MQFLTSITAILSAVACVSALPKPEIEKRAVGGVLICTGANATGDCIYNTYALDKCIDVPAPYTKNTGTFAPDGEAFYCWGRVGNCSTICESPTGCTFGNAFYYGNPHKYDLAAVSWKTSLMSFDCHLNSTT
ncbi:hypothetical protein F5Y16DRAFT_361040 [Xylariaceae sp. FL0255]|nr:hypothetical protein F5Y16DRAFT_361040 [Xylariaceae sp. FL0255]